MPMCLFTPVDMIESLCGIFHPSKWSDQVKLFLMGTKKCQHVHFYPNDCPVLPNHRLKQASIILSEIEDLPLYSHLQTHRLFFFNMPSLIRSAPLLLICNVWIFLHGPLPVFTLLFTSYRNTRGIHHFQKVKNPTQPNILFQQETHHDHMKKHPDTHFSLTDYPSIFLSPNK